VSPEHTPGPWTYHCNDVHPTEDDDGKRFWEVMAGKVYKLPYDRYVSGYIACPDLSVAQVQFGPAEANARLIAAAPDLLELVEDIEESLTADGTYKLLREACRAAILKAKAS